MKALVELLAGISSVVYGLIGIGILGPWVQTAGWGMSDSLLTAGLLLAVMILPTVLTLTDDALRDVGRPYRESARALGFDRTEAVLHGVLPVARSGSWRRCSSLSGARWARPSPSSWWWAARTTGCRRRPRSSARSPVRDTP